jgi:hypothetical protein
MFRIDLSLEVATLPRERNPAHPDNARTLPKGAGSRIVRLDCPNAATGPSNNEEE